MNSGYEARKAIRQQAIKNYKPDDSGLLNDGIFGLPFKEEESEIILIPVPWEVTVSYLAGTAKGPEAIRKASTQIDLFDPLNPTGWQHGIFMQQEDEVIKKMCEELRPKVVKYLDSIAEVDVFSEPVLELLTEVNRECEYLNAWVENATEKVIKEGKIAGIVGGEHSVPLGYLHVLSKRNNEFGILHIDAHADLRNAYEGFTYSHASIFFNALDIPQVKKIVQVGIRDFSEGENALVHNSQGRVIMHTDYEIRKKQFAGIHWQQQCDEIINQLPEKVYISFDIDGLQPWLSPHTGTPVPGGFSLEEAIYLLEKLVDSGRKIIGFDLCEVAPGEDEWDGNVGARVLYKLCMLAGKNL
ncbi:MAG: agmatinase family protein [Bacteroidetes bacterium]|nr:agmatinase family protein [Bacteroidota bacterium]